MCGSVVLKCDCKHNFQDKEYGKGWRIHNSNDERKKRYICTVCGKSKRKHEIKERSYD